MESNRLVPLFQPFAHLTDPRRSNARHLLFDMFVIALCAVISGFRHDVVGWPGSWQAARVGGKEPRRALCHCWVSPIVYRCSLGRLQPQHPYTRIICGDPPWPSYHIVPEPADQCGR